GPGLVLFFFFSSRRRHTRSKRDWSSDVCSSDLAVAATGAFGVTCLTGVSPAGRSVNVDAGALNRDVVLENDAIVGSVNANLGHYAEAARILAASDLHWLGRMITRRVPLARFAEAFDPGSGHVKAVIALQDVSARGP